LSSAIEIRDAAARSERAREAAARRLAGLQPLLTIGLFLAGMLAGGAIFLGSNVAPPRSQVATAPLAQEPRAAAVLADAISHDDARALSQLATTERLEELGNALQPLQDVTDVVFVEAVEQYGDTLSAYVVRGHDASGMKWAVGLVLRVRDDKLVGVN
jgi:hypothetical protein